MGFDSYTFGFNEPTLASMAYVCYFLAFVFYSGYLMARSSRSLRVARGQTALAGAGAGAGMASGGTVDVSMTYDDDDGRPRVGYSSLLGRIAVGLVVLSWASLTSA